MESFIGKLRDELLNGEIFYTLTEAKVLVQRWRQLYNRVRPHSALGYRPPAPEAIEPLTPGFPELLDIGEQSTNSKNGATLGDRAVGGAFQKAPPAVFTPFPGA